MKLHTRTLVAAAVLAAVPVAMAANVTLYGVVDEGVMFHHAKTTGKSYTNTVSLDSGINSGSRWGMRGTEELGGGVKVGFKLESGFTADDGALQKNRLFRRESQLNISGSLGTLAFGQMGGIGSSAGTFDTVFGLAEASDGVFQNSWYMAMSSRNDNTVTYASPVIAGFKVLMQYSFKTDSVKNTTTVEGSSRANRYYSAGLTYANGPANAVLAWEYTNRGNDAETDSQIRRNAQTVSLGGNYDFGAVKLFALAQYADGMDGLGNLYSTGEVSKAFGGKKLFSDGMKGVLGHIGVNVPTSSGLIIAGIYGGDLETGTQWDASNVRYKGADASFLGLNIQYNHKLSKRTGLYTGAGWYEGKIKSGADNDQYKSTDWTAYVGMTHKF